MASPRANTSPRPSCPAIVTPTFDPLVGKNGAYMCAPGGDLMTTVNLPGGSCRKSIPCDTAYVRSYGSGIAHPYRERLVRRECNGGALHTVHAGQWTFVVGHLIAAGCDTCRIAIK